MGQSMNGRERSDVQDAFHYAVAACGGTWRDHESAIAGRDGPSRSEALRAAFVKAGKAFSKSDVSAWRLPRYVCNAPTLARLIYDEARARGVDASMGEPLCVRCGERGRFDEKTGLCVMCPEKESKK